MTKPINYPTAEWIAKWCETRHCSPEDADMAWWDLEIEKGNPTPFDLTEDQAKVAKTMTKGAKAVNAYGKTVKRERKPDEVKREVIATVAQNLHRVWLSDGEVKVTEIEVANAEREITFRIGADLYSLTLTKHRQPKG